MVKINPILTASTRTLNLNTAKRLPLLRFVLSCFLFRGTVRNGIPRVCFYFCSTERNSELFSLPRGFGTEFREFASIFVRRNGIPRCFLFRGRIRNGIPRFSVQRNSRNSVGNNHLFRLVIVIVIVRKAFNSPSCVLLEVAETSCWDLVATGQIFRTIARCTTCYSVKI